AAGHVLTAVVADPLDHRGGAGVAHAEAFPDQAAEPDLTGGGPVPDHVPGDDVVLGDPAGVPRRVHHDPATGQTLAEVVVGVADQPERQATRDEGAEALSPGSVEGQLDGVVGQPMSGGAAGDLVAQS